MGMQNKDSPSMITPDFSATPNLLPTTIWDQRPKKYKNILLNVCLFILVMELAERLSYYGINQGLKNFMHDKLGIGNAAATSLKNTWTAVCYLSPLMGAWIADEKWGRYKTILIFGMWYFIGDLMVAIGAHPDLVKNNTSVSKGIFLFGLFGGIGIGTGAIKSNVVTFGADQFDPNDKTETDQRDLFFSLFYWCINIGACFSYGYLTSLSVDGSGAIPAEYGYFYTFLICALVMFLALVIFFIGTKRYVKMLPVESALTKLVSVICTSTRFSFGAKVIAGGFVAFMIAFTLNLLAALIMTGNESFDSRPFSIVAGISSVIGVGSWIIYGMNPAYMDASKISFGGVVKDNVIDEIKLVIRVLPWAACNVIWNCVYDQIDASYQSITQQCDLRLGSGPDAAQIPGATLGIFDPITIVIMIPILDYAIYPLYTKIAGKKPSSYGKAAAGLLLASLAMIWTGCFEIMRRNSGALEGTECYTPNDCKYILAKGGQVPMNKMPWTANIFHYVLVGTAECLINVTAFDVFYSNVPEYLKSTCQSISLLMTSMGANVASIFTLLFHPYITDDLNQGHIEYMFFTVGAVSILNLIIFMYVMVKMQFGVHDAIPAVQVNYENKRDSSLLSMNARVSGKL